MRTGMKQASQALRQHGIRPFRVERTALKGRTHHRFGVVPLAAGLTDSCIQDQTFVIKLFSSLTDMVSWAREASDPGPHGKGDGLSSLRSLALRAWNQRQGRGEEPEEPPAPTLAPPSNGLASLIAEALRPYLEQQLDKGQVSDLIREIAGAEIKKAADGFRRQEITITIPQREPIDCSGEHQAFPALVAELAVGNSVYVSGPSGSGKTTGAIRAAEKLGMTYFVMPPVSDPYQAAGFIDAGGTYRDSQVYRWATTKGALLILDEVDRSNPRALTSINALWNGLAVFPHEQVVVPPENAVVATANTWGSGADAEYVGSARLDAATLNRLPRRIYWGYDEQLERRIVQAAVGDTTEVARCLAIRKALQEQGIKIVWSPRDTVAHCRAVTSGSNVVDSLRRSALASLPPEKLEAIMEKVK